ncbi:ATP synthase F0 subunit 6 (mitochondrion) [Ylistrum balloti]|uniref:ATP synthase F0 subunit 6 n=1 Tax=Ylistrum balloti TaxID=509963 RepID=UPI00226D0B36|nr:ATP synthase F0 subunit 6 [Ylistrum balloti]UZN43423.1 ATP synthase F0 subunit 6 [Ylistrum balloti]
MSLSSLISFLLPFAVLFMMSSPFYMSPGGLEVLMIWLVLSISKFFCIHEWGQKCGSAHILTFVFVVILSVNLLGMIPFVKSVSCLPVFVMSYGLLFWSVGSMWSVWGLKKFSRSVWVMGAPLGLNLFVVFVELLSWVVRPVVLGVRLMINVSCGHIIMSLMGEVLMFFIWNNSFLGIIFVGAAGFWIGVLEWIIMLVQTLVFVGIIAWSWGDSYKVACSLYMRRWWLPRVGGFAKKG